MNRMRWLTAILVALAILIGGCQPITPVAEAPLADAPLAAATEAPAEEAAAAPAAAPAAAGDVNAIVSAYLAGIPEGYLSVGKLDAFKSILELGEAAIIDVREPSEYEAGHVEGAINIPIRTLAQSLDKVPTDKPVVLYCASGHRAGMATAALQSLGYGNVRAFPGGWKAWSEAGEAASTEAVEAEVMAAPEVDEAVLAAVDSFLSGIPEGFYALGAPEKLQEALDAGAVLIDVREPSEYAEGAILDAVNIPIRELGSNLDAIPQDRPVVVYCASGFRAAQSLAALQTMGYGNVRSFPPGYGAWEAAAGN
jgi:rhodanese-related sulfurtransferase